MTDVSFEAFVNLYLDIPSDFTHTKLKCKQKISNAHHKLQYALVKNNFTVDRTSPMKLKQLVHLQKSLFLVTLYRKVDPMVSLDIPIRFIMNADLILLRFHYMSDKPTNILGRPDMLFDEIVKLINDQLMFFNDAIQPCYGEGSANAHSLWVKVLLGLSRKRIQSDLPRVYQTELYPAYIQKILDFDLKIRAYVEKGDECILIVLENTEYYQRWVSLEVSGKQAFKL